jgi:hypothetical protein
MVPLPSESSPSAYRSATERPAAEESVDGDRERLHPVLVLVWIASLARVVGAVWRHEVLGSEATLALLTVVGLSWYALAVRRHARDQRRSWRRPPTTKRPTG